jgi:cytochrome P450
LPFGFGKRACPGKRLAEVELYIMTAKFFHAFDVSLVDDIDVEFNFLLTPAGPLRWQCYRTFLFVVDAPPNKRRPIL